MNQFMNFDKIKVKHYPQSNPKVKDSQSRFAVKRDKNGDVLEEADPSYPVCEFVYDPKTITGSFVQLKDHKGRPLFQKSRTLAPYLPSEELIELVKLAQVLQRPV